MRFTKVLKASWVAIALSHLQELAGAFQALRPARGQRVVHQVRCTQLVKGSQITAAVAKLVEPRDDGLAVRSVHVEVCPVSRHASQCPQADRLAILVLTC